MWPGTHERAGSLMGTVLAFDFGEKRIGVATGETLLGSAHPLTVIHAESNDDRFAAIGKLIAEWRPDNLLVVADLLIFTDTDLTVWRQLAALAAGGTLIVGFIWEAE